jgi:hypothetical protein
MEGTQEKVCKWNTPMKTTRILSLMRKPVCISHLSRFSDLWTWKTCNCRIAEFRKTKPQYNYNFAISVPKQQIRHKLNHLILKGIFCAKQHTKQCSWQLWKNYHPSLCIVGKMEGKSGEGEVHTYSSLRVLIGRAFLSWQLCVFSESRFSVMNEREAACTAPTGTVPAPGYRIPFIPVPQR